VASPIRVCPTDPGYPSRLRSLSSAPEVTFLGGPLEAPHVVAVVGSREASAGALDFARSLAAGLVRAGAVVVSGGAVGIDTAAHEGALDAGGRTWCVAGTGYGYCFPPQNEKLFDRIANSPAGGAMVWPFRDGYHRRSAFPKRNAVLVTLADAVVVVEAGLPSGALHAARCARRYGRPLWVVPSSPWMPKSAGVLHLLATGARMLVSPEAIPRVLGGRPTGEDPDATASTAPKPRSENDSAVLRATSSVPLHADAIATRTGLPAAVVTATLLTLALENVLVEGPPGFFRHPGSLVS
jgi:DNA processing protein